MRDILSLDVKRTDSVTVGSLRSDFKTSRELDGLISVEIDPEQQSGCLDRGASHALPQGSASQDAVQAATATA